VPNPQVSNFPGKNRYGIEQDGFIAPILLTGILRKIILKPLPSIISGLGDNDKKEANAV
jgi:hypothetical protein